MVSIVGYGGLQMTETNMKMTETLLNNTIEWDDDIVSIDLEGTGVKGPFVYNKTLREEVKKAYHVWMCVRGSVCVWFACVHLSSLN